MLLDISDSPLDVFNPCLYTRCHNTAMFTLIPLTIMPPTLTPHPQNNWVSIASVTTSCFVIVVLLAALLVYLVKRRRAVNSYHTKQVSL